jgi:nitrite reductase/ring-hydroxylating ferredoxin subunit
MSIAALQDGDMQACQVDGVNVLICRVEGRYHAVSNRCSHASQTLSAGRLRGAELTCPLHGARFDVRTGACLAGPAERPIKVFPVVLEAGKVCVQVSKEDRPPRPRFGPLN